MLLRVGCFTAGVTYADLKEAGNVAVVSEHLKTCTSMEQRAGDTFQLFHRQYIQHALMQLLCCRRLNVNMTLACLQVETGVLF